MRPRTHGDSFGIHRGAGEDPPPGVRRHAAVSGPLEERPRAVAPAARLLHVGGAEREAHALMEVAAVHGEGDPPKAPVAPQVVVGVHLGRIGARRDELEVELGLGMPRWSMVPCPDGASYFCVIGAGERSLRPERSPMTRAVMHRSTSRSSSRALSQPASHTL